MENVFSSPSTLEQGGHLWSSAYVCSMACHAKLAVFPQVVRVRSSTVGEHIVLLAILALHAVCSQHARRCSFQLYLCTPRRLTMLPMLPDCIRLISGTCQALAASKHFPEGNSQNVTPNLQLQQRLLLAVVWVLSGSFSSVSSCLWACYWRCFWGESCPLLNTASLLLRAEHPFWQCPFTS